jgi:hypothetical protein
MNIESGDKQMIKLIDIQILKDNVEGFIVAVDRLTPISHVGIHQFVQVEEKDGYAIYTIFDEDGSCIGFICTNSSGKIIRVVPHHFDFD